MAKADEVRIDSAAVAVRREGLQERVFQVARWMLVGPMVLLPLLFGLADVAPWLMPLVIAVFLAPYLAAPVALAGLLLGLPWRRGPAQVEVRDGELRMNHGGKLHSVPLAQLRSGWLQPRSVWRGNGRDWFRFDSVEIETENRSILAIEMPSREAAQRLLEATGLDARRRVMRLQLGPTDFQTALLYLLGPGFAFWSGFGLARSLHLPEVAPLYLGLLVFVLLRACVQAFLGPARITVGADGIKIEQNFSTRFIPYQDIKSWIMRDDAVVFELRDGRRVTARARHLGFDQRGAAVRERLEQARLVHTSAEPAAEARALLVRGQQTLDGWRTHLRSLLERSDYRQAPLSEDDLLSVLSSPDEPAEMRLGAALALPAGQEAQRRLRVAAEACANPRLRVALEQLADGHDDPAVIEAALADEPARPAAQVR